MLMIDLKKEKSPVWEVSLHESNLGLDSGKYMRTITRQTIDRRALAERVAGSLRNISPGMAEAVLAEAEEHILRLLAGGYIVSGELGRLTPSVSGVWDGDRQSPEARSKAAGKVTFAMSAEVKAYFARTLFREQTRMHAPRLFGYTTIPDGDWNAPVGMRGSIFLQGQFLLMQHEDGEQGIRLHDAATGREAGWIPASRLPLVQDKRVMVQLPEDLPEGTYTVTVVNRRSTSGRPTKKLRSAVMETLLSVGIPPEETDR